MYIQCLRGKRGIKYCHWAIWYCDFAVFADFAFMFDVLTIQIHMKKNIGYLQFPTPQSQLIVYLCLTKQIIKRTK